MPVEQTQKIHSEVLANGIKILFVENPAADIISGRIFFKDAGMRAIPQKKAGLTHLLASVITKGTQGLSSAQIAERIESVGASLGADAAADYFLISLKTVSKDFSAIFQLAGEILRSPSFPQEEFELEQGLTLQDIRSQQEQPFNVAYNQLRQFMYKQHPYGVSVLGTQETVSQLTRQDLQEFHQNFFQPSKMVVSISGRLKPEAAFKLVQETFGDWQVSSKSPSPHEIPNLESQPEAGTITQDTQQSIVILGYLASSVYQPDFFALKLLNTYLGNGLSSRLFVELREKRGLAYDVSSFYPTRVDHSQFVVYIGTAPENTEIALTGLRQETKRLCETELTSEELQTAKNKLLGQYALGKQTNSEIAQIYGWYETLNLGVDFDVQFQEEIAKVTPQLGQETACRYFGEPYVSIVGPVGE
ncbi:MAG: pitrilysin family protein [Spirulinaceae cyanobacterium]